MTCTYFDEIFEVGFIKRGNISKEAKGDKKILYKRLERYPFVCLDCPKKYTSCALTQLRYDSGIAQKKYEYRLHETRKGINLTPEEHKQLNAALKEGLLNKKSIYSIIHSCNIDVFVPTVQETEFSLINGI